MMKLTAEGAIYNFKPTRSKTRDVLNVAKLQGCYYTVAPSLVNFKGQGGR